MAICELCGRETGAEDNSVEPAAETVDVELESEGDVVVSAGDAPSPFDVEIVDLTPDAEGGAPSNAVSGFEEDPNLCPRCHRPLAGAPRCQEVIVAEITAETEALPEEATDVEPE